jgi:hypothetical protein
MCVFKYHAFIYFLRPPRDTEHGPLDIYGTKFTYQEVYVSWTACKIIDLHSGAHRGEGLGRRGARWAKNGAPDIVCF